MIACLCGFYEWRESRNSDLNRHKVGTDPATSFATPYRNTAKGVAYVGDEVYARCHVEISQAYRRHPMGRSATTPEEVLPGISGLVFEVKNLAYSIERRDNRLLHRETRKDGSAPSSRPPRPRSAYVIGSGTRGYSFLVERNGGLFQSPISWYSQRQKWDLAPGYHERNLHFDRVITAGCLFCHTNRFDREVGKAPVFHGLAIGCERCHGPGELHARHPEDIGKDMNIINPVDLKPTTLRRTLRTMPPSRREPHRAYGRLVLDYRPGLPLEKFLRISSSGSDLYSP